MEEGLSKIPEWKNLYDAMQSWEYEDDHKHIEFENILGIKKDSNRYYPQIERAGLELLTRQNKLLVNIHSIGYKLVHPEGYPDEILRLTDMVYRRARKVVLVTEYAPEEEMTQETLNKVRTMRDRAFQRLSSLKKDKKDYLRLLKQEPRLKLAPARESKNNGGDETA